MRRSSIADMCADMCAQGFVGSPVRLAVFVPGKLPNNTFGVPLSVYPCGDLCYNATANETFW